MFVWSWSKWHLRAMFALYPKQLHLSFIVIHPTSHQQMHSELVLPHTPCGCVALGLARTLQGAQRSQLHGEQLAEDRAAAVHGRGAAAARQQLCLLGFSARVQVSHEDGFWG